MKQYLLALGLAAGTAMRTRFRRHGASGLAVSAAAVLEQLPDGILVLDEEQRIVTVNPIGRQLLGHPLTTLQGLPLAAVLPEALPLLDGAGSETVLIARERPDAEDRLVLEARRARLAPGRPEQSGWLLVLRDVTAQQEVAAALQRSDLLLRATGSMAGVGGWEIDLATGVMRWADEVYRIHGLDRAKVPTIELAMARYHGQAQAQFQQAAADAISNGQPWDLELPFVSLDGQQLWVRSQGQPVYEGRTVVRLQGAFQDITERKAAEARLWQQTQLLDTFLENAPVGMALVDRDLRFVWANEALAKMDGVPRAAYAGQTLSAIVPGVAELAEPLYREVFRSEQPIVEREISGDGGAAGERWHALVNYYPLPGAEGRAQFVGLIVTSITARKEAEMALQQLNSTLQQRVTELSMLNQITQAATVWSNLADALESVGTAMLEMFAARGIGFWRLDEAGQLLTQLAYVGREGMLVGAPTLSLSDLPIAQQVMAQGQAVLPHPGAAAALAALPLAQSEPGGCLLLRSLRSRNAVIGLLAIRAHDPNRVYSAADASLAETVPGTVANLVENARLFEQARANAAEEERRRLARDLHDSVSQALFAATLAADVLPELWELDPDEGREALGDLQRLTRGALAEMRTLLMELRPTTLLRAPLSELLEYLVDATRAKAKATVDAQLDPTPSLPPDTQVAFYRIAQEALHNVVKHANARQISIWLCAPATASDNRAGSGQQLTLRICDDGRGFDPARVVPGRLGLEHIYERAASIGAKARISSQPGAGTEVVVAWQAGASEEETR